MQWFGYLSLRLVSELFRFVPFRLLYWLSDAAAFSLYRVIGYRRQVAMNNLRHSFPEKSEEELQDVLREFYRNLTDVALETIKSNTMSLQELERRCFPRNPEKINAYLEAGKSIILTGSHLNNWEWACLSFPQSIHGNSITAYKPFSNRLIDRYVNRQRNRAHMQMISMDEVFGTMRRERAIPSVYVLLADQSPSSRKSAHWIRFLGQETASLPGPDVLARKFNYPILYYQLRRLRRGFYEMSYYDLYVEPAKARERDISRAYAAIVELDIRSQPQNWLWSHKRWKMKRNEQVTS